MLDQVMARNRMDSRDEGEEETAHYSVKAGVLFVAVVTALVTIGVAGVMHARRPGPPAVPAPALAARRAYTEAVKALDAGNALDALKKLRAVQMAYPGTDEAGQAALKLQQVRATVLDRELQRMAELEAAGDYAGAFKAEAGLRQLDLGAGADALLKGQDELARRLARAAYASMDKDARKALEKGDRDGALKLYRRMRDSVGIPELSAQADAKVKQLESNG